MRLFDAFNDLLIQPFVSDGAIVVFDVGVLLRLTRLDMLQADLRFLGPIDFTEITVQSPSADTCGWFARDVATFACVGEVLLNASLSPSLSVRLLVAFPPVRIKLEPASNTWDDDDFTDLTGLVPPYVAKIAFSP